MGGSRQVVKDWLPSAQGSRRQMIQASRQLQEAQKTLRVLEQREQAMGSLQRAIGEEREDTLNAAIVEATSAGL